MASVLKVALSLGSYPSSATRLIILRSSVDSSHLCTSPSYYVRLPLKSLSRTEMIAGGCLKEDNLTHISESFFLQSNS